MGNFESRITIKEEGENGYAFFSIQVVSCLGFGEMIYSHSALDRNEHEFRSIPYLLQESHECSMENSGSCSWLARHFTSSYSARQLGTGASDDKFEMLRHRADDNFETSNGRVGRAP